MASVYAYKKTILREFWVSYLSELIILDLYTGRRKALIINPKTTIKQHFQLPGIFISLLFYISSKTTIPFSKFKFVKSYTRKNRIPFGIACGSGFISVACAADSLIRWFTRSACTISCIKSR